MARGKGTCRIGLEYFSPYPPVLKVETSAFLLLIIGERSIQTLQLSFPDSRGHDRHLGSVTRDFHSGDLKWAKIEQVPLGDSAAHHSTDV